ncbi:ABC transporter permease, partial [Sinorhizobium medicae]
MIDFLLARIGSAIVTIFGASVLAFSVLRAVPTNPARLIAGPFANDEVIAQVTANLGLDKSLPVQYLDYVTSFFIGDWGFSYSAGQPVLSQI